MRHAQFKREIVFAALVAGPFMLGLGSSPAQAQQQPAVVQLPTFSSFSVSTSVLVPDRGGAYLGGIGRSASGSSSFGPPLAIPQGGWGRSTSAAGVGINAFIHDLTAMDQDLLSQAGGVPLKQPQTALGQAVANAADVQPHAGQSVSALKAQYAAQQAREQQSEALSWYTKAAEALAAGKTGVAKIYLGMAAKRATGELAQEIAAKRAELNAPRVAAEK